MSWLYYMMYEIRNFGNWLFDKWKKIVLFVIIFTILNFIFNLWGSLMSELSAIIWSFSVILWIEVTKDRYEKYKVEVRE